MTVDELIAREAIRHTIATYNKAGDEDDPDGFANCFAEDGVMQTSLFRHEGREQIRTWKAAAAHFKAGGKPAAFRIHNVSSIHIELTSAETAKVRSCWFVVTDIGPDHAGIYHDRFRKVGEDWLIEERLIDNVWRADNSFIAVDMVGRASSPTAA